jgi:hypothetical protein
MVMVVRKRIQSWGENHRSVVITPVAPHVALTGRAVSLAQATNAVAATAMSLIGYATLTGVTGKVMTVEASILVAASKCTGGKHGAFEEKDNCEKSRDLA